MQPRRDRNYTTGPHCRRGLGDRDLDMVGETKRGIMDDMCRCENIVTSDDDTGARRDVGKIGPRCLVLGDGRVGLAGAVVS